MNPKNAKGAGTRRIVIAMLASGLLLLASEPVAAEDVVEIGAPQGVPVDCQPNDIDLDAEGKPWFTCTDTSHLGVIDPATKIAATYQVNAGCGPFMGVFDQAGKYWFTMRDCNRIGMIDPTAPGVPAEIPVEANGTEPKGIAVDAGGRLWVNLETGDPAIPDKVGRYDPVAKTWQIATMSLGNTQLFDITVMRNGQVVTCDFFFGGLYRVDQGTMEISRVPVPSIFEPTWCREAPTGNLWVTSHGPNTYLMEIDPDDEYQKYQNHTYPQTGLLPYALAFDKHGNGWFTEHLGNHVQRVTDSGAFGPRIPLITVQSYPFSIAIDQQNCDAWIGQNAADKIAYVPGRMICPDTRSNATLFIAAAIAIAAAVVIGVVVFLHLKRKRAAEPEHNKKEIQRKKDAL